MYDALNTLKAEADVLEQQRISKDVECNDFARDNDAMVPENEVVLNNLHKELDALIAQKEVVEEKAGELVNFQSAEEEIFGLVHAFNVKWNHMKDKRKDIFDKMSIRDKQKMDDMKTEFNKTEIGLTSFKELYKD